MAVPLVPGLCPHVFPPHTPTLMLGEVIKADWVIKKQE